MAIFFTIIGITVFGFTNYIEHETLIDKNIVKLDENTFTTTSSVNIDSTSEFNQEEKTQLQIQRVLDLCACQESGNECIEPIYGYSNETHSIDNLTCKWKEIPKDESSQLTSYTTHLKTNHLDKL